MNKIEEPRRKVRNKKKYVQVKLSAKKAKYEKKVKTQRKVKTITTASDASPLDINTDNIKVSC